MNKVYSEYRMVEVLKHENIVCYKYFIHMCIRDLKEPENMKMNQYKAVIIMEQLNGGSLKDYIRRQDKSDEEII